MYIVNVVVTYHLGDKLVYLGRGVGVVVVVNCAKRGLVRLMMVVVVDFVCENDFFWICPFFSQSVPFLTFFPTPVNKDTFRIHMWLCLGKVLERFGERKVLF